VTDVTERLGLSCTFFSTTPLLSARGDVAELRFEQVQDSVEG
jgi:hypothetical protein